MKFISVAILAGLIMSGTGYAQSERPEIEITKAEIKKGKVYVIGKGGIPGEPVHWVVTGIFNFGGGQPVLDTVDQYGHFSFVTDELPTLPRCRAEVVVGELLQETTIIVDNCKGTVVGYYTVSNNPEADPEQMTWVAPGQHGRVSVDCNPGDAAVSSDIYITTNTNTPANASIVVDALSVDSRTHIQSRNVRIVNHGEVDTELRVSAVCAEIQPPESRSIGKVHKH